MSKICNRKYVLQDSVTFEKQNSICVTYLRCRLETRQKTSSHRWHLQLWGWLNWTAWIPLCANLNPDPNRYQPDSKSPSLSTALRGGGSCWESFCPPLSLPRCHRGSSSEHILPKPNLFSPPVILWCIIRNKYLIFLPHFWHRAPKILRLSKALRDINVFLLW